MNYNRYRQLSQLQRHAPDIYHRLVEIVNRYPQLDHNRRIAEAMQELMSRLIRQVEIGDTLASLKQKTSAGGIGADIKRMLGHDDPEVEAWQPTQADKDRARRAALRSQQPKSQIGSKPLQWRY